MQDYKSIIRDICAEGWTLSYPQWVRDTFVRVLKTEGEIPLYAEVHVSKAIKVAEAINYKMDKQTSIQATSGTKRDYSHQKKDKKARDAELRNKMKNGGKVKVKN